MDLNKFDEPFSPEDIEWRIQQSGKTRDGKVWAMVLAYVTNRAIMKRLDDVCGKAGWRNENTQVEAVKGGRSGAMKRAAVQWGIGRYLYNLEEGFAQTSLDKKQGWHRAKLKDGTGFYWLPPSLPGWAIPASDNKPSPENTNQKSPSVDCEQILKDFSDYVSTETDKKKLIERYQRDWQLMAGNEEAQAKCVQVMNIRVNELKQAA